MHIWCVEYLFVLRVRCQVHHWKYSLELRAKVGARVRNVPVHRTEMLSMSQDCKETRREGVRIETRTQSRAIRPSALEAEKREKQKMQPERQGEARAEDVWERS